MERSRRNAAQSLAGPLRVEAERIMTDSKRNYVPVDTGVLRASGVVQRPEVTRQRVRITMGYGGAARAYAVVQHERLDFRHTVGEAKYLEKPVKAAAEGFGKRIAKNLDLFP